MKISGRVCHWMQLGLLGLAVTTATAVSGDFSRDLAIDNDQKVCMAICGVDYEEIVANATAEATAASLAAAEVAMEINATASDHVLRILSYDTGSMDLMGRQVSLQAVICVLVFKLVFLSVWHTLF